MKKLGGIFVLLLITHVAFNQTTISYQGQNYWGGAYVAPVWTKTYKDYSIPSSGSSSSSYSSPNYGSSSNYSSGSGNYNYEYKPKSGYSYDPDRIRAQVEEEQRLKRIRNEKANTQAKLYFAKLEEAKNLIFNEKLYSNANMELTYSLAEIYKTVENGTSVFDEFANLIKNSYDEKNYYVYLTRTKLGYYDLTIQHYNYYFTTPRERSLTVEQSTKMLPLTANNYYFMGDTLGDSFFKRGNLTLTPQDRFRVDLFFVHSLIGKGQLEDAKIAFKNIMQFYKPIVPDMSYVADELTIICFNLGEMDLAQMNLEYYCEHRKSNSERYRLVTAILEDKGWDGHNKPQAIEFLERNFIFLENLERDSNSTNSAVFYDRNWNILYTQKSDNLKAYVERKKEYLKIAEKDPEFSSYGGAYMVALLKLKDETEINRVLQKLKTLGVNMANNNLENHQKKMDELLAEYKGFTVKKDYEKDLFINCWRKYYDIQTGPTINALFYFEDNMLKEFYAAGGCKYVKPFVAEYIEFLDQFTVEEMGRSTSYFTCISFGKKKSRSYPKVFEPPIVKVGLPK